MEHEPISYINAYLALPNKFIENGYYSAVKEGVLSVIKGKAEKDPQRLTLSYGSEDKEAQALAVEIKKLYPEITIKGLEPNFIKHKRKAYIKRNQNAWLRATHVIIIREQRETLTQRFFIEKAEEGNAKFVMTLCLNEEDKSDEQPPSFHPNSGEDVKGD